MQVVIDIVAVGPKASGKTRLIKHFQDNLPIGYKISESRHYTGVDGKEVWTLVIVSDDIPT